MRLTDFWAAESNWYDRNRLTPVALDGVSKRTVGYRKSVIWRALMKRIPRTARVLEVGCGEGLQMHCFAALGFTDLMGCDVNPQAVFRNPYAAEVLDLWELPYEDGEFDLVYTSGLLIHIPPDRISEAVAAIARVSRTWVAGYEYHAPLPTPVKWRGQSGLMWKADYPGYYERAAGLSLAKSWLLAHIDGSGNADHAFLLTK